MMYLQTKPSQPDEYAGGSGGDDSVPRSPASYTPEKPLPDVNCRVRTLEAKLDALIAHCARDDAEHEEDSAGHMFLRALRAAIMLTLLAITIYVLWYLTVDWVDNASQPSATYSLMDVDSLAMPTAGMIPAPYATDSRCFDPVPQSCTAYFGEASPAERKQFDCMSWLSSVNTTQRTGSTQSMTIWTLDGVKASAAGYYFTSILDYVQYTFRFDPSCTEPYLWVFVSGDSKIVTKAKLDPALSMRSYAQSSFLIQGGQYVMVAFSLMQDVDLNNVVTNTSLLSASAMMVSAFNASKSLEATAVFRPGTFKIQSTVQVPGQSFIAYLANVGGWLGLLLGFSFSQVFDLIEWLTKFLAARSKRSKTPVDVVGVEVEMEKA